MTWNYRIVQEDIEQDGRKYRLYSLREVYYNRNRDAWAMDAEPEAFRGYEDPVDLIDALEMALADARKHPVFVPPEKWAPDDITLDGTIKVQDNEGNISEFYCPVCNGIVIKLHTMGRDPFEVKDSFLSCYKCNTRIELDTLGLKEVEDETTSDSSDSSDSGSDTSMCSDASNS